MTRISPVNRTFAYSHVDVRRPVDIDDTRLEIWITLPVDGHSRFTSLVVVDILVIKCIEIHGVLRASNRNDVCRKWSSK